MSVYGSMNTHGFIEVFVNPLQVFNGIIVHFSVNIIFLIAWNDCEEPLLT